MDQHSESNRSEQMNKKQRAAKQKALDVLDNISSYGDTEADHGLADEALTEFLDALGHNDVADAWRAAYERAGFWYA